MNRLPYGIVASVALAAQLGAQQPAQRETVRLTDTGSIPRAVVDDVARIVNAASTRRITGDLVVRADEEVDSDIAVLAGQTTIAGHVRGRVIAVNGDVILRERARVDGDIVVLGGRISGRDGATVGGAVQEFANRVTIVRSNDASVAPGEPNPDERWWQLRERWRSRSWSHLRLVSTRTYNRVEGLPVLVGPQFGRDLGWGRLTLDLLGVVRSVGSFEQSSANLGHDARVELRFGRDYGVRVGGQLFDVVDPVEPWHLTEAEVGLSSFFLRRDFSDYYNRHGGTLYAGVYLNDDLDLTIGYSDQRWATRPTKNPLTLFRNNSAWRPNPAMDEGTFHVATAALSYDTRNDVDDPWSGWYVTGNYEFGRGTISRYAPTSPGVRQTNLGGQTEYDRMFIDVRRYNRVSPEGQLNARLVVGGWLSGDDLPLQRRLSVSGPGVLPGYDFRRMRGATDFWQCSNAPDALQPALVDGLPAQCSRVALAQLEYRGELRIDPWGFFAGERSHRRWGWGRSPEWVAFVDAGRGWLVGPRSGDMAYPGNRLPPLGTFRADIGLGLKLDDLGIYLAKGVSEHGGPLNVVVRLKPRF
ncbi:MAG: hypothetical protein MNPFHGCM_01433 [Gemmatimonadaceae bacterium]|nr:hypothetical protein [Gemmatimonadaceae bacterium]